MTVPDSAADAPVGGAPPGRDTDTPRRIADRYVETLADLDPLVGASLGIRPGVDAMPDFSPDGDARIAAARRATLAELDAVEATAHSRAGGLPDEERRAARLLRERLDAQLAIHAAGDPLRRLDVIFSPVQSLRSVFLLMPADDADDWAVIARRMRKVPEAAAGYRASLTEGVAQGLLAAPRQARAVVEQLDAWSAADWYGRFVAAGPDAQRTDLDAGAAAARTAIAELRDHLAGPYAAAAEGTPDAVGRDRYALWAREWTGSDLDLDDSYAYGWDEFHRLTADMRATAEAIVPGSTPGEAMRHLDEHAEAVEGEENIRAWLQALMDDTMVTLEGTHFDIAPPVRTVESMVAPPGSAAAGYYTRPSLDFSRPGRTWFPTLGETRFPLWKLVSTWYHEGVPGHHLQLAQWVHLAEHLSRFQVSLGSVSATTEGWALYAERLMDELGYLADPGRRMGYLDEQLLRAIRVVVDIGMHLRLPIPDHSPFHPGETWTPELAREFALAHSGLKPAFVDSEIVRYLGNPGQAISYKLGERAWLAGRAAAESAAGRDFDRKRWHMAALSMGSLGLDDLVAELSTAGQLAGGDAR